MSRNATITRFVALSISFLAASCAHPTLIQTDPPGAELYIDGVQVGITPYTLQDTPGSGDRYEIVIQKSGYQIVQSTLRQDQFSWPRGIASVTCGLCSFGLGCLGLLTWSWQLQDQYSFVLQPAAAATSQPALPSSEPSGVGEPEGDGQPDGDGEPQETPVVPISFGY